MTEHVVKTDRHTTFYLAAGPEDGPLLIFVHGWPELSISWRHQLPAFAALGFRCVAPDMRGYGRSSVPGRHEDYAQAEIVTDMIALLDALGRDQAVWIGHDWGSPVVWNIASHHPERTRAVASLCIPYGVLDNGLEALIALVDRSVYPEEEFPAGQWEYMRFYEENFAQATAGFESNPYNSAKVIFRRGDPDGRGKPSRTAFVRKHGGWFGPDNTAPDIPRDENVVSEADLSIYAASLQRNGFFGADSFYMNHEANGDYARTAKNGGVLSMPVLFIAARYDYTCECIDSDLAKPQIALCENLTTRTIDSGHWMAQEKPVELNAALSHWLATEVPDIWPIP
ncbi:MAG: alpha/beta hydrolase [Rhodospirillaceae bacterium]|nr:alpha/beta hydrolase [Rhodospirillaceae bacterium]MBT5194862.1 alpha/beta hydrolase [Rhodospirillaceae bacterium]MBT5895973.1 alpha/beta hydrolase [Rhodospirillaceae bacterium]